MKSDVEKSRLLGIKVPTFSSWRRKGLFSGIEEFVLCGRRIDRDVLEIVYGKLLHFLRDNLSIRYKVSFPGVKKMDAILLDDFNFMFIGRWDRDNGKVKLISSKDFSIENYNFIARHGDDWEYYLMDLNGFILGVNEDSVMVHDLFEKYLYHIG